MAAFNLTMFFLLAAFPLTMLTVHHAASTIFFLLLIATLISIPFQKKISWNDSPFPGWLYASIAVLSGRCDRIHSAALGHL
jgi:hypothetical protein